MGRRSKLGSYGKNRNFWPKTEILGPKKNLHFCTLTMFWPLLEKVEKRPISQINISLSRNFGCFFLGKKCIFGQKNTFQLNKKRPFLRNSGRTRSVVILGHFLIARTVPTSFVENSPKLRVLILVIGEWPKTAKNRGEPQKMTRCSETKFFWGWSKWVSFSPGHTGDMPC